MLRTCGAAATAAAVVATATACSLAMLACGLIPNMPESTNGRGFPHIVLFSTNSVMFMLSPRCESLSEYIQNPSYLIRMSEKALKS